MKVNDYLAKRKFSQIENLKYFNINILLDIDAATSKECLNDLNENCIRKTKSESATMDKNHPGEDISVDKNYKAFINHYQL